MSTGKIVPVILSGGSGTRLWPLSRALYPNQLQPLTSDRSMLQETALRVSDGSLFGRPLIVASNEHRFIIAEQVRQIGVAPKGIMLEPVARNTSHRLPRPRPCRFWRMTRMRLCSCCHLTI